MSLPVYPKSPPRTTDFGSLPFPTSTTSVLVSHRNCLPPGTIWMSSEISKVKGPKQNFCFHPSHIGVFPSPIPRAHDHTQLLKWPIKLRCCLDPSLCLTSLLPAPVQSQNPLRRSLWHVSDSAHFPPLSHPRLPAGWISITIYLLN